MEAYLMNPNSVSLKVSTQKKIIKRKGMLRIYKFSWVILKMGIFLKWFLLLSHRVANRRQS